MKFITSILIVFYTVLNLSTVKASGGEDHTHAGEEKKETGITKEYFSSEANSDKYELFLKYKAIKVGEKSTMQLFVSEFNTNKAIDKAIIQLTCPEDPKLKFEIHQSEIGIYTVSSNFPMKKNYSLQVSINSILGADLMVLQDIKVGQELTELAHDEQEENSFFNNGFVLFFGGFILALLLMYLLSKLKNRKVNSTFLLIVFVFGTTPFPVQNIQAHGGEDHEGESKKVSSNFSDSFEIKKETQFLFNVFTQKINIGDFNESTKLFGTIIPSSEGQAIISAPQNGKLISLNVKVGQKVKKGQKLAVFEQTIDAFSKVNLQAEKNNINAEFDAAKKEYERLNAIKDIASKKEIAESESRYQKALDNKKLFNSSLGKTLSFTSPIDGIIGNFNFSMGSTINANETIFTITNLNKVYIEAQVFDKDAEKISAGIKYVVECTNDNHKTAEVKLLALAQTMNATNQSQRVLFEMENKGDEFKIGEFVNISVFASQTSRQIAVPNSSISELNGKPIVFIKNNAEQYSVKYISLGENNGSYTIVEKGINEDDRIVINGTYQLKMIYLNQ